MGRPNGTSETLDQPSPPPSANPPSPKGRTPRPLTSTGAPTTFFLKSEEEVEQPNTTASTFAQDSTYGVHSLQSTISVAGAESGSSPIANEAEVGDTREVDLYPEEYEQDASDQQPEVEPLHRQRSQDLSSTNSPSRPMPYNRSAPRLAFPLVPLQFYSPSQAGTESAPLSTPRSASLRSLQLSDEESAPDDTGSQAIASSSGEEDNDVVPTQEETEAAPQLVMPSIRMPTRRPFTEKGKSMGKLKVMVVGSQASGKTSLIKSIVQLCEDIVHVDPLESPVPTAHPRQPAQDRADHEPYSRATKNITEISASTRAYPSWWSDVEESKILRRKRSLGEPVLERNITFLDTPGYSQTQSSTEVLPSILTHVENLLRRNASLSSLGDSELLGILSGNGGTQVDLVLFVLEQNVASFELEFLKKLSTLTNVLPLISKADLHTSEETQRLRQLIVEKLNSLDINPFLFGHSISNLAAEELRIPYAISSASSNDHDNMDASLLMSPDYIQPLAPSDLTSVVAQIFNSNTTAWLRHTSARKFLQWRKSTLYAQPPSMSLNTIRPPTLPTPSAHDSATTSSATSSIFCPPSPVLVSHPFHPSSSQALARITDHTQREERLAQVRLARWATDLRRAMSNERARYTQLQHEQRTIWLEDRLNECRSETGKETIDMDRISPSRKISESRTKRAGFGIVDPIDPLGVLDWDERVRRRLGLVLKVVGGCGVIGAVTVWLIKAWSWWGTTGFNSNDGGVSDSALGAIGAGAGTGTGVGASTALMSWLGSAVFVN